MSDIWMGVGIVHRGEPSVAFTELYPALLNCNPIYAYKLNGVSQELDTVNNDGSGGAYQLIISANDAPDTIFGPDGNEYPEFGRSDRDDPEFSMAYADSDFDAYGLGMTVVVVYMPKSELPGADTGDSGATFMRRESPGIEPSETIGLLSLARYMAMTGEVDDQVFKNFGSGVVQAGKWYIQEIYFPPGDTAPVMYENGNAITGSDLTTVNSGTRTDRGTLQVLFLGTNDPFDVLDSFNADGYYAMLVVYEGAISSTCRTNYVTAATEEGWFFSTFLRMVDSIVDSTNLAGATAITAHDITADYIYVGAEQADRLITVSVATPSNISIAGNLQDTTNLNGIFDLKYLSSSVLVAVCRAGARITTIDITTPTAPAVLDSLNDSINYSGLVAVELDAGAGIAYALANSNNRIIAFDISSPSAISELGSLQDSTNFPNSWDMAIYNDVAFIPSYNADRLTSVDLSNPAAMSVISTVSNATTLNGPWGIAISADGQYAFIACEAGQRLTVVDISNPASMSIIGNVILTSIMTGPRSVVVNGDIVYVSDYFGSTIGVIDVSTPSAPEIMFERTISDTILEAPWDMVIRDGHLFVTGEFSDSVVAFEIE
jgi:hypothetical protein